MMSRGLCAPRTPTGTAFKGCCLWYVSMNYLSMPICHVPISDNRISDIGKLTDLPKSENQNDLPISVIIISDIGKSYR